MLPGTLATRLDEALSAAVALAGMLCPQHPVCRCWWGRTRCWPEQALPG